MECCICETKLAKNEYGNNPWPVRKFSSVGDNIRCCNDCNEAFILPFRIILAGQSSEFVKQVEDKLNEMK